MPPGNSWKVESFPEENSVSIVLWLNYFQCNFTGGTSEKKKKRKDKSLRKISRLSRINSFGLFYWKCQGKVFRTAIESDRISCDAWEILTLFPSFPKIFWNQRKFPETNGFLRLIFGQDFRSFSTHFIAGKFFLLKRLFFFIIFKADRNFSSGTGDIATPGARMTGREIPRLRIKFGE